MKFWINGIQPKQRPRHLKNGHTYTPRETVEYERLVAETYNYLTERTKHIGPIGISLEFVFIKPKSAKREYPTTRPDIDNCAKSVIDGLKDAWTDDSQICELNLKKRYGDRRGVWVDIWEI